MEKDNNIFEHQPTLKLELDSSSLTASKLTDVEFKDNIEEKLQAILDKVFVDNVEKRKIKHPTSGLEFACPFCRDSATDNKKKRGHILLNGRFAGVYKCFNCGQTMKIQKFFQEFDQQLTLSDITYISNNLATDSSSYSADLTNITSNIINKDEAYKLAIERNFIKGVLGLQDIGRISTPIAYEYLINRCQYANHERFLYSPTRNQLYILNLIEDKVIGMQIRNLNENYIGPKYLTMTIDKMREIMLGDKTPVPDYIAKLSCVFNIFNVDFSHSDYKPVLVTEGPFDAFLLPNCIALSGAAKNFNMQFPFWYVFDDDKTGSTHAMEKLRQGYKVFMWKKFKYAYGLPDRKKWDVSDVMQYHRDHKLEKKILWSPYFTNSTLDGLNI